MIKTLKDLLTHFERCVSHEDQGHWLSVEPIENVENFGFLYAIHNTNSDKFYLGKKQFNAEGRKTRTVNGKRKKNPNFGKDTGWRDYLSSSDNIKKDIVALGKDAFVFYHVRSLSTKGGLSYLEPNLIHRLDCLTELKGDGERRYYNNNASAVRFIPKEF